MDIACWFMLGVFIMFPVYLNYRQEIEYERLKLEALKQYQKSYEVVQPSRLPPMWYDYSQLLEKPEQEQRADPFWDGMMWADLD